MHARPPARRMPAYIPARHQLQPTADRYREIESALAAKGYLSSAPDGVWNRESATALQRFQQDHKLEPTGKINARSLEALGLGPAKPTSDVH